MKTYMFIVFLCCLGQLNAIPPHVLELLPPEITDMVYNLRKACAGKSGVTNEEIDSYVITNDAQKFKCYMQCMMLESKWMTDDAVIHYDDILAEIHPIVKPILERAFKQCRTIEGTMEGCGKAYNFHACIAKADPVHYFLP